jgi:hypothetical protein
MVSKLPLRPTQPPLQWVKGALSLVVRQPGRKAEHSLPPSTGVKNSGAVLTLPHTSLWCGASLIKHRDTITLTSMISLGWSGSYLPFIGQDNSFPREAWRCFLFWAHIQALPSLFQYSYNTRGRFVGVARGYKLDDHGSIFGGGRASLLHSVETDSESHPPFYLVSTGGSFPGVKRPKREADHSPITELKNDGYTTTHSSDFMA